MINLLLIIYNRQQSDDIQPDIKHSPPPTTGTQTTAAPDFSAFCLKCVEICEQKHTL